MDIGLVGVAGGALDAAAALAVNGVAVLARFGRRSVGGGVAGVSIAVEAGVLGIELVEARFGGIRYSLLGDICCRYGLLMSGREKTKKTVNSGILHIFISFQQVVII